MRKLVFAAVLLFAVAAFGEELTVDKIIAAHGFGAPADKIVEKINDPANTVAPLAPGDLDKLRAAGVPETVIAAVQARAVPAAQPIQPDNPSLTGIVKLVQSGLTESLIIEQVKQSPKGAPLTTNDLIYLKANKVPDAVVAALMSSVTAAQNVPGASTAPAKPVTDATIEGLLLIRGTFLSKNHQGKLTLEGDNLTWASGTDSRSNFTVKATALEKAWLKCRPLPAGKFCYELGFKIFKGDDYSFRDVGSDEGSNDNVTKLREVLQARFQNLVFEEKLQK